MTELISRAIGPGAIVADRLATLGITEDDVIDWIATEDLSHASIAKRLGNGLSASSVRNWLQSSADRSARVREARHASADAWLDRAHDAIASLPDDGTHAQIAKMREMRQHAEKRAAIRNPDYSERRIVDGSVKVVRELHQMSDAELIEFARKQGVEATVIEGVAEALDMLGA